MHPEIDEKLRRGHTGVRQPKRTPNKIEYSYGLAVKRITGKETVTLTIACAEGL